MDRTVYHRQHMAAVLTMFIGTAMVSAVFGMFFFALLTEVCTNSLLHDAAKFGYVGVAVLCTGLLLEVYTLYERHRRHVSLLAIIFIAMCLLTVGLIHYASVWYSC